MCLSSTLTIGVRIQLKLRASSVKLVRKNNENKYRGRDRPILKTGIWQSWDQN